MTLLERIYAFSLLGNRIVEFLNNYENHTLANDLLPLNEAVSKSFYANGWFAQEEVIRSLKSIANFLQKEKLEDWVKEFSEEFEVPLNKKVGVIMAGNVPLVGFHDLLCVLIAGHRVQAKLSGDDQFLIPALVNLLKSNDKYFVEYIEIVEKLEGYDAIIATGSNNSARYFESYFSKVPNIIRKNRTSVALLSGDESLQDLQNLGKDIFYYFGLGCRNVTKLYLPENFDLNRIFEALVPFDYVMTNNKYMNNYSYNQTLYLMNNEPILDNNFMILKEDVEIHSPIGALFYERYKEKSDAIKKIELLNESIQCVVGKDVDFGGAQFPALNDYADGVDTLSFLTQLNRE